MEELVSNRVNREDLSEATTFQPQTPLEKKQTRIYASGKLQNLAFRCNIPVGVAVAVAREVWLVTSIKLMHIFT